MYTELPVCKRCCFCLPLRYGLIGWGYFKLLISSLIFCLLCVEWHDIYEDEDKHVPSIIIACIVTIFVITDITLTITFIVGCHMKNVRVIQTFYFYSKIAFVLITISNIYDLFCAVTGTYQYGLYDFVWLYRLIDFGLYFANIVIQFYILLLVRSEIIKLKNGQQFKFVNLASDADADCTVNMDDSSVEKVGKV